MVLDGVDLSDMFPTTNICDAMMDPYFDINIDELSKETHCKYSLPLHYSLVFILNTMYCNFFFEVRYNCLLNANIYA